MIEPCAVTRNWPWVGARLLDWLDRLTAELLGSIERELAELDTGVEEGRAELAGTSTSLQLTPGVDA